MTDARDRTIGTMLHSQHKQERELVLLGEAARTMLAALKAAKQQLKPIMTKADHVVFLQVAAAIAQAEAAGIKEEG